MKAFFYCHNTPQRNALYPTWFRWKAYLCFKKTSSPWLYIPHGSDESIIFQELSGFSVVFISHMVQMKAMQAYTYAMMLPFFISHMVQMKAIMQMFLSRPLPSLYPTWFRWKLLKSSDKIILINIFISHMVQMKVYMISLPDFFDYALYPTWFRWKSTVGTPNLSTHNLYIPHGSDESF